MVKAVVPAEDALTMVALTVLVIGGAGFLGQHIIKQLHLLENDWCTKILVFDKTAYKKSLGNYLVEKVIM